MGFCLMDKLKLLSIISYVNFNSDNCLVNGYGLENINYLLVVWGLCLLNIDNFKDYWQLGLEGIQQYLFNYIFFDNFYFILQENCNVF